MATPSCLRSGALFDRKRSNTPVNALIVENLTILMKNARSSPEPKDGFRATAYRNAINSIKQLSTDITSGKDATLIKGIGKRIGFKIQEIIDTGDLHQASRLAQSDENESIEMFTSIWGVGPRKAKELWDGGARDISDLHRQQYIQLLTYNQLIGLRHHKDFQKRVLRSEVTDISRKIRTEIDNIYGMKIKMRVCGSYRRKLETCGDVDILLTSTSPPEDVLQKVVSRLERCNLLGETLGLGKTKYMGVTYTSYKAAFRIDMEIVRPREWSFALLYFTGSGGFNERQRAIAKEQGYRLSEHGLVDVDTDDYVRDDGRYVRFVSEKEIFKFLGMRYIEPENRT